MFKKSFKILCLALSVLMVFATIPVFAVDGSVDVEVAIDNHTDHAHNDDICDHSVEQKNIEMLKYDSAEEYYKDVYDIEFVEVIIDGTLYYVNKDIKLTKSTIDSIRNNVDIIAERITADDKILSLMKR